MKLAGFLLRATLYVAPVSSQQCVQYRLSVGAAVLKPKHKLY